VSTPIQNCPATPLVRLLPACYRPSLIARRNCHLGLQPRNDKHQPTSISVAAT
jgi:hypothetical protein